MMRSMVTRVNITTILSIDGCSKTRMLAAQSVLNIYILTWLFTLEFAHSSSFQYAL